MAGRNNEIIVVRDKKSGVIYAVMVSYNLDTVMVMMVSNVFSGRTRSAGEDFLTIIMLLFLSMMMGSYLYLT